MIFHQKFVAESAGKLQLLLPRNLFKPRCHWKQK